MLTQTVEKIETDTIQLVKIEANMKAKEAEMREKKLEIDNLEDRITEKNVCIQ